MFVVQAGEGWESWNPGCPEEEGLGDPEAYLPLCPFPCPQIELQRAELQSLREELQRQKELRQQEDPEEALNSALSDREEAVNR